MASSSPVNARTFFRRRIEEMVPNTSVANDETFNQDAHHVHRVMRAQFRRGKKLRKVEA